MIETLFEVILNVLLMFSLLSCLFILLISKLEEKTFNDELENIIENTLNDAFSKLDEENRNYLKQCIESLKQLPVVKRIISNQSDESKNSVSNQWLITYVYTCIGFLLAIFIVFCLLARQIPNLKFDILRETGWAIFVFSIVCLFEATFFILVAKHYVPVPPSTVVYSAMDVLKKW